MSVPEQRPDREARLGAVLADLGSVLVAFSGGADSTLVAAAAVRALGSDRVVAATGVSPSLAGRELVAARDVAARLGVRHVVAGTDEMSREGYRANGGDRCFFCKTELMSVLVPLARTLGMAAVATGTNADDLVAGFRPGIRAAADAGARTPLADAGFTKADVRALSARWQLPTWDKPAAACLSSRIAYGVQVTPARLARVERAEEAVRRALAGHGVRLVDLRVRDLGEGSARVELDAGALAGVRDSPGAAAALAGAVSGEGFRHVATEPFRSGSMNALLPDPERYR